MSDAKPTPYHVLRDPEKQGSHRRQAVLEVRGGASKASVAERYGISRQTLYTWLSRADGESGEVALFAKGPDCRLSPEQKERLAKMLRKWPREHGIDADAWTLPRVRDFIEREFSVSYAWGHVALILADIGFSRQKPERQARQRDPEKVEEWNRTVLPGVEKKSGRRSRAVRR